HPDEQDYQRIVWRSSSDSPIKDYRLKTVTYGTSAAPFLATRTLSQLAADEQENYPKATRVLLDDFYVDDLLSGEESSLEATKLCQEMNKLLLSAGFSLR